MEEKILILDFGSQYTQLIARRVRELNIYCEIFPYNKAPKNIKNFSEDLDKTLQRINSDYQAKRYKNMTLNCLKVNVAKKDLFYSWLKKKGKIGGQHKVPRLSNNRNLIEELLDYEAALS